MSNTHLAVPRHIFVSYSRQDKVLVHQMLSDLGKSDFEVWVDEDELAPGTSDWQNAIRVAMQDSIALLLMATPNSAESVFVQAELALAKQAGCHIVPVWIDGNTWINCVPLEFVNTQYIDCREDQYSTGLRKLFDVIERIMSNLPRHFPVDDQRSTPKSCLSVTAPMNNPVGAQRIIAFDCRKYSMFQDLLNDLYLNYLADFYLPHTYGRDWLLGRSSMYFVQLAVPWIWLSEENRRKPLFDIQPSWASATLDVFSMRAGSHWVIRDHEYLSIDRLDECFGLVTSDPQVASLLDTSYGEKIKLLLGIVRNRFLKPSSNPYGYIWTEQSVPFRYGIYDVSEINPNDFTYHFVMHSSAIAGYRGKTIVLERLPDTVRDYLQNMNDNPFES